jgi:outer membrane protein assembly factor BamB
MSCALGRLGVLALLAVVTGALTGCGIGDTDTASLVALDARDGHVLWKTGTDANGLTSLLELGGEVRMTGSFAVPGACEERFRSIVFDRATGRVRRENKGAPAPYTYQPEPPSDRVDFPDGTRVRSTMPNQLTGVGKNGRVLWRIKLRRPPLPRVAGGYHRRALPIEAGPGIVLAFPGSEETPDQSYESTTTAVALDPHTGRVRWRESIETDSVHLALQPPLTAQRTFYLFIGRNELEALDPTTGAVHWRVHVAEGRVTRVPGRILVASPGRVTALSHAGTTLWSTSIPTGSTGSAFISLGHRRVYVVVQGYDSGCGD